MNILLRRLLSLLLITVWVLTPPFASAQTVVPANTGFESSLVALINADRADNGASTLNENMLLTAAAQKKADDMITHGYFAHTSPQGVSPWHWLTSVGYRYTNAAENLAMNFNDATSTEAAWMASPAHRANIIRRIYKEVGIGISHGIYLGKPVTFTVELFATPAYINPRT